MGKGERGDGDNFWKCIADGLVDAGVIHSDAAVSEWHLYVRRDRDNPRTVIEVKTGCE
jgi:Holliday junction resolvase RusA-like endonuclease